MENAFLAAHAPTDIAQLTSAYGTNPTIRALVDQFGISTESAALYPGSNDTFVRAIYNNVLNRDPLTAGLNFWMTAIDQGTLSRGNAALAIMNGALENQTAQGLIDAMAVLHKSTAASDFTAAIDSALEIAGYSGAAAAASARTMLRSVTDKTDTASFLATIATTLDSIVSAMPNSAHAMAGGGITLVGLEDPSMQAQVEFFA
ncbi:MAG: DUF4214 domain-containing protein [Proteobacteria bacterium]|nr:DUF4214 domain-containing protein [Pseudomonadota bacterium]